MRREAALAFDLQSQISSSLDLNHDADSKHMEVAGLTFDL